MLWAPPTSSSRDECAILRLAWRKCQTGTRKTRVQISLGELGPFTCSPKGVDFKGLHHNSVTSCLVSELPQLSRRATGVPRGTNLAAQPKC